jgi:CheY-like chemotaxis protein
MQMPEMDGLMLTSEIRRFRDAHTLPLVVLTSLGQRKAETEVGHEFAAYLTKPIKASQLYNALMHVFAKQSTRVVERAQTHAQVDTELAQRVPLRILVAEDNAINQKLALQLLKKMGYRADVVANGLEVLDVLGRQPYDVILMDMQMPEMDGLEATRLICQEWPMAERPRIIAMTANAMQEDRDACFEAGMDDYVVKPIRVPELQAALERCGDWLYHRATGARSNSHSEPIIPIVDMGTGNPMPDSSPEPIDQAVLKGLQDLQVEGEPDILTQFITVFMDETPLLMTAIRTGVLERNADNVRKATHSLKSNCASLGAQEMAALCATLEKQARSGSLDDAAVLVGQLEQEWKRVAAALIAEREVRNGHLDR